MTPGTHSMIFSTGEPAYAVDRDGTIVAWNSAAGRAFGYDESQALGGKCWELLQGNDAFGNRYCGENCPLRRMALEHQSVNRCRMFFRTAGGDHREFTVTTLALFDTPEATLIHMCRPQSSATGEDDTSIHRGECGSGEFQGVLTPREGEVLRHLAEGHTTREIAALLSISVHTVRGHVEHILRKLHVHSRLEAVAVSRRLGIN